MTFLTQSISNLLALENENEIPLYSVSQHRCAVLTGVRFSHVEPKSCFHAGDFVARRGAIASICRRPAPLDLGLAFRWPISRARRSRPQGLAQIASVVLCVWQCHLRNISTLSNRTPQLHLGEIAVEQTVIASELDDLHSVPAPRLE